MRFLKSLFALVMGLVVACSVVGCKESDTGGRGPVVYLEPGDSAARTVLVYIMAENNLTDNVRSDLNEMMRGIYSMPDSCYLLAFVDNVYLPYICRLYQNSNGVAVCDTVLRYKEDFYSTDTARFREVVTWVLEEYPSDNLGLVMWSHGSGWIYDVNNARSIGVDNGQNRYDNLLPTSRWMEVEELAAVLESLPVKSDYVLYDACFMQSVEAAYAMRNASEWVVGSPAELPANGAPYDLIMPSLFSFPFSPDSLINQYKRGYSEYNGVMLSAVKTSAMERLAEITADIFSVYFSCPDTINDSKVFSYLPGGCFSQQFTYPEYCDMNGEMMLRLPAELYAMWKEAFDAAVPYKVASSRWASGVNRKYYFVDKSQFCGVSMYVPRDRAEYFRFNSDFRRTEWYDVTGWEVAGW